MANKSNQPSGGPADRPAGAIEGDESVPSLGDAEEGKYPGGGTLPPQDTGSAVPPYEGRQTSAKPTGEGTEGGVKPVESSSYKAPAPGSTEQGATASPADEQPAAEQPETDRGYDTTGPAHTPGTGRGEKKL